MPILNFNFPSPWRCQHRCNAAQCSASPAFSEWRIWSFLVENITWKLCSMFGRLLIINTIDKSSMSRCNRHIAQIGHANAKNPLIPVERTSGYIENRLLPVVIRCTRRWLLTLIERDGNKNDQSPREVRSRAFPKHERSSSRVSEYT